MKREIIAKALNGKGKLIINESKEIKLDENVSKTLGCWIINHRYSPKSNNKEIFLNGSYDIQLWYALDNDSRTNVYYETMTFEGRFTMSYRSLNSLDEETTMKVHVIKYPSATNMELKEDGKVILTIESEYFIDTFQDAIIMIDTLEEDIEEEIIDEEIVMNVNPNYLKNSEN